MWGSHKLGRAEGRRLGLVKEGGLACKGGKVSLPVAVDI